MLQRLKIKISNKFFDRDMDCLVISYRRNIDNFFKTLFVDILLNDTQIKRVEIEWFA